MATADDIFAEIETEEPHIIIDKSRFITVPSELQRIAVQYDHDIETVTFDCPRYWDGHDLSTMIIYINYKLPNGARDSYHVNNVTIDSTDTDIIHFDWTLSRNVTSISGKISFSVCAKNVDSDGNELNHWNSELNQEMYISQGLECLDPIVDSYPDVITGILVRLDELESVETLIDESGVLAE